MLPKREKRDLASAVVGKVLDHFGFADLEQLWAVP